MGPFEFSCVAYLCYLTGQQRTFGSGKLESPERESGSSLILWNLSLWSPYPAQQEAAAPQGKTAGQGQGPLTAHSLKGQH